MTVDENWFIEWLSLGESMSAIKDFDMEYQYHILYNVYDNCMDETWFIDSY